MRMQAITQIARADTDAASPFANGDRDHLVALPDPEVARLARSEVELLERLEQIRIGRELNFERVVKVADTRSESKPALRVACEKALVLERVQQVIAGCEVECERAADVSCRGRRLLSRNE